MAGFPAIRRARAAFEPVTASTACGKARGASVDGVAIFRGLPYGGPAEGAARFLPPSKPIPWSGVRDATATGPRAVQGPGNIFLSPLIGEYFGGGRPDREELARQTDSENCLVLNVLTPGLRGRRPVMVYIHGGGFSGGSGILTLFGDGLVREQDVVLVGVNHRLNVFGYAYLGGISERYSTGNPGQLDLVAALEWVRENIANFGGDPGNVTIFGESGGGAKICTLMAMPGAKGLFHKAAVQSGTLFRVDDADSATRKAREMLAKLGLKKAEDLQKVPAADLLKAGRGGGLMGASPVVDGRSLTRQPWDPTAPDLSASVPMIIGNCKDEATLFTLQDESLFKLDDAGLRAALVKARVPAERVDALIALYRRNHPKEGPSDLFFRISADRGARWNAARQAELKLAQGQANVYVYYFQWNTPCVGGRIRAFHTADLPLTMRLVRYPESEQLSRQLSGAWAAFARNGSPGRKELAWPAYTVPGRATMVFDAAESRAVNDPDREERILVRDLPSGSLL
ncbi:MAG: carboxylesterase/lipase family protein [Bryobacterales bacterium]|nr:carboxylesterase/lipase family protein [Bryobacterales bacterium]